MLCILELSKCGVTTGQLVLILTAAEFFPKLKSKLIPNRRPQLLCYIIQPIILPLALPKVLSVFELAARRSQELAKPPIAHAESLADEVPDTLIYTAEQHDRAAEDCKGQIPSAVALACTRRVYPAEDIHQHPISLHLVAMLAAVWYLLAIGSSVPTSTYKERLPSRELPMGASVACGSYGYSRS